MKKVFVLQLYRLVSFLSNITRGSKKITNWKLALGILLISGSATGFTSCKPSCYDAADPTPTDTTKVDSTQNR